jgi:hypothetical protein
VRGLPAYGVARRSNNLGVLRQRATGGGGASSLLTGLVSYWKLDETSGTRFDSVSTNHLTDNNAVGSATGKINPLAAQFTATNQSLSNSSVTIGTTLTVAVWIYLDSDFVVGDENTIFSFGGLGNAALFGVDSGGNNILRWYSIPDTITNAGTIAINTWTFIVAKLVDNSSLSVKINDGAPVSAAKSGSINPTTYLLLAANTPTDDTPFPGRIGPLAVWSRETTNAEDTELYNGGSGLVYPFA